MLFAQTFDMHHFIHSVTITRSISQPHDGLAHRELRNYNEDDSAARDSDLFVVVLAIAVESFAPRLPSRQRTEHRLCLLECTGRASN